MKEIATIANFNFKDYNPNDTLDNVSIIISGEEDLEPHFHIIGENFDCSLCIYKPEYHKDTKNKLNKDQLQIINNILSQSNNIFSIPNQMGIKMLWDGIYDTNYMNSKDNQIDYTKIN